MRWSLWSICGLGLDGFWKLGFRFHERRFPRWGNNFYHLRCFRGRRRRFGDLWGSGELQIPDEWRGWALLQLGEWRSLDGRLDRRPSLRRRVTGTLHTEPGRPLPSARFAVVGRGCSVGGGTRRPFLLLLYFLLGRVAGGMRDNTRAARSGRRGRLFLRLLLEPPDEICNALTRSLVGQRPGLGVSFVKNKEGGRTDDISEIKLKLTSLRETERSIKRDPGSNPVSQIVAQQALRMAGGSAGPCRGISPVGWLAEVVCSLLSGYRTCRSLTLLAVHVTREASRSPRCPRSFRAAPSSVNLIRLLYARIFEGVAIVVTICRLGLVKCSPACLISSPHDDVLFRGCPP